MPEVFSRAASCLRPELKRDGNLLEEGATIVGRISVRYASLFPFSPFISVLYDSLPIISRGRNKNVLFATGPSSRQIKLQGKNGDRHEGTVDEPEA